MKSEPVTTPSNPDRPKPDYVDKEKAHKEGLPNGPLGAADVGGQCWLLIFVPRNTVSSWINGMTGGYGYSHLAVDCGEVDIPSGRRVMIESTFGLGVHNSFQDEYGGRHFVRIPLQKIVADPAAFCACVRSKLGEKFDDEEILTFGMRHNPAKQICSDLATVCLPEEIRADIARCHQAGLLHSLSTVRYDGNEDKNLQLFVSPNGFAEYFGAPKGGQLAGPDQVSEPEIPG